jgi:predicted DNA-binding transcriptional regulator AlpA
MAAPREVPSRYATEPARTSSPGTPTQRSICLSAPNTSASPRRLLKEREAARFLGLSCGFLRASRLRVPRCSGPPFVRVGRAVRYDIRDLEEWVQQHRLLSGA